jgi:hypothetical protein
MSFRMVALGTLLVTLPVAIEIPDTTDGDGGETRISLMGGAGRYAIIDRGCEGQVLDRHPARFEEVGGSIEHRFANNLALGVRGGAVRDRMSRRVTFSSYPTIRESVVVFEAHRTQVNPYVAIDAKHIGLGAGWFIDRRERAFAPDLVSQTSFHVRLGRLDRTYFRLSHQEGVPRWTGGQVLMGFGGRPHPRVGLFAGLSGGDPFDGAGAGLEADILVAPHWLLLTKARLGNGGGAGQNAIAIGLTYTSRAGPRTYEEPPDRMEWAKQ